jgi:hypothetical protein
MTITSAICATARPTRRATSFSPLVPLHLLPMMTSCHILCSKATFRPRAPSRPPLYVLATSSCSRRISAYRQTSSSCGPPTHLEPASSGLTNSTARRIGSSASPFQRRRSCLPTRSCSISTLRSTVRSSIEIVPPVCLCSSSHSGCAQQGHPRIHWHIHDQHSAQRVFERGAHGSSADGRAALGRERAMGEHRARCGLRNRLCGLYWARDTCSDEHKSSKDESGTVGPGD